MRLFLNYHNAAESRLKRARLPLFIIAIISGALLAWAWVPKVSSRFNVLLLQRQCLQDMPPRDQAVFDTRPDSLPQWKRSDPDFTSGLMHKTAYVARLPSCWTKFVSSNGWSPSKAIAVLFMHRMRSPAGHERLVTIEAVDANHRPGPNITIISNVIRPGSALQAPSDLEEKVNCAIPLPQAFAIYVRPLDPNHLDRVVFELVDRSGAHPWQMQLNDDDEIVAGEIGAAETTPRVPPLPASSRPAVPPASPATHPSGG